MEKEFDQVAFFVLVRECFNSEETLHAWMSKHFGYTRQTVYRKMNGEIKITVPEFHYLFQIIPGLAAKYVNSLPNPIYFLISLANYGDEKSFSMTLDILIALFERVIQTEGVKLRYIARDVIFFFFFKHPELIEYKIRKWTNKKYGGHLTFETKQKCKKLYELYTKMDTEEIWLDISFQHQWFQLKEQVEYGELTEERGKHLWQLLVDCFREWTKWTFSGTKSGGGKIKAVVRKYTTMNNGGIINLPDRPLYLGAVYNARFYNLEKEVILNEMNELFTLEMKRGLKINRSNPQNLEYFKQLMPEWESEG